MDILENLNKRLTIDDGQICYGGERDIEEIRKLSPIPLPKDYIGFLRSISGGEDLGMVFSVDSGGNVINIWSAQMSLMKREEFNDDVIQDFMEKVWLIGDDLGELVFFYGDGRDGHGIYRTSAGDMSFEYAEKIADSLTGFLSGGIGIDVAVTL